jgi:hypothetical protein
MPVSPDRIQTLRQDPDFRALVKCLKSQEEDRIDAFLEYHDESTTPGGDEHGREDTPDLP